MVLVYENQLSCETLNNKDAPRIQDHWNINKTIRSVVSYKLRGIFFFNSFPDGKKTPAVIRTLGTWLQAAFAVEKDFCDQCWSLMGCVCCCGEGGLASLFNLWSPTDALSSLAGCSVWHRGHKYWIWNQADGFCEWAEGEPCFWERWHVRRTLRSVPQLKEGAFLVGWRKSNVSLPRLVFLRQ